MPARTPADARILFVLSRDFGELGFAMALLRGQALAGRSQLILPDRLYSVNQSALPVPASRYTTLDDIIGIVDAQKPDLVFLLSGYLFSGDRLLSLDSVQALVGLLRDRGCRVVTSDPWLGLAPRLTLADVNIRVAASGVSALHRWLLVFMSRVLDGTRLVANVPFLHDLIHVYATGVPAWEDGIRRLTFFNPATIRRPERADGPSDGRPREEPFARPRWLFVISQMDLNIQLRLRGARAFSRHLLALLARAAAADRDVTLIAPPLITDRLGPTMARTVELVPSCPYEEFEERLLDAEYVFYWNAFSFSQTTRAANGLPFFVFDRGHASRIAKPYYDIARACHFGGWEPPQLDQVRLPEADALANMAREQEPALRAVRERWRASPTPDELVTGLLQSDVMPEST